MYTDFILNGHGRGEVGSAFEQVRFEPGLLRPFRGTDGRKYITVNTGRVTVCPRTGLETPVRATMTVQRAQQMGLESPVLNTGTALRKNDWIQLDATVTRVARKRLKAWGDLMQSNSYGGFNGMSKMTLEYQAMSDPGEARVDMDGLTDARNDSPKFLLRSIPLPITHSDFSLSARYLAQSRNSNTPLDMTMAEAAARRVAESIEQQTIGTQVGATYGTQTTGVGAHDGASTVWGYTTVPSRITVTTVTIPTGSNPDSTVNDVLSLRSQLYNLNFFGPFMVYHSTDWDRFMDNDYARLGGNNANMTLRDRLRKIDDIMDVKRLDYLTNTFTLLLVQMTGDYLQAVNGMDITTVQWEEKGGLELHFKVMAIQVPRIKWDYNGTVPIVHATTA